MKSNKYYEAGVCVKCHKRYITSDNTTLCDVCAAEGETKKKIAKSKPKTYDNCTWQRDHKGKKICGILTRTDCDRCSFYEKKDDYIERMKRQASLPMTDEQVDMICNINQVADIKFKLCSPTATRANAAKFINDYRRGK